MWRNGNTFALLVGIQIDATTVGSSIQNKYMEISCIYIMNYQRGKLRKQFYGQLHPQKIPRKNTKDVKDLYSENFKRQSGRTYSQ